MGVLLPGRRLGRLHSKDLIKKRRLWPPFCWRANTRAKEAVMFTFGTKEDLVSSITSALLVDKIRRSKDEKGLVFFKPLPEGVEARIELEVSESLTEPYWVVRVTNYLTGETSKALTDVLDALGAALNGGAYLFLKPIRDPGQVLKEFAHSEGH